MEVFLRRWAVFAMVLALATGQTLSPANFTSSTADLQNDDGIKLSVSEGGAMIPLSSVLGLTDAAKNNIPPTGLSGSVFLADPNNQLNLSPSQIAIISCDPVSGFLSPLDVLNQARSDSVKAILLYSEVSDYCNLSDYSNGYQWIYSMKSQDDTQQMLGEVNPDNGVEVYATIGLPGAVRVINGTDATPGSSSSGSNDQNNKQDSWEGARSTTAVAMIILYAITGLITALFLVIIVTGAFRAHRHPERYGPRIVAGQTRQSRAKGLARAFLDTLPIVKTGEREDSKPTDVELTGGSLDATATRDAPGSSEGPQADSTTRSAQPEQTDGTQETSEEGIAPATESNQTPNPNLGCSICTEDFETGQDQRVLPCDHRFHPECVDPWLLNVSGTCPLCRIDLRPEASRNETEQQEDEDGNPVVLREGEFEPPPLAAQETEGERQRMSVRRSIVLGIMGIGRPDQMTREERVLALRQLRGRQLARQRREEQAAVVETPEEETRTRRRLRDVLGIRTRRTGGQQTEASQEDGPESDSRRES